ncbi:hypothetical protein EDD85DRAFT_137175 [Armillaria nabsnona]|nr:hypothetical protein EDD85DRAFT_137175 [Armillaria nabsnona]
MAKRARRRSLRLCRTLYALQFVVNSIYLPLPWSLSSQITKVRRRHHAVLNTGLIFVNLHSLMWCSEVVPVFYFLFCRKMLTCWHSRFSRGIPLRFCLRREGPNRLRINIV